MTTEPNAAAFFKGLVAWLLRMLCAGALAYFGASGICAGTEHFHWQSSEYVCGHNVALTLGPLFIVIWLLLEVALPMVFRGRH